MTEYISRNSHLRVDPLPRQAPKGDSVGRVTKSAENAFKISRNSHLRVDPLPRQAPKGDSVGRVAKSAENAFKISRNSHLRVDPLPRQDSVHRVAKSVEYAFKQLKTIPFFENLNQKEVESVYFAMHQKKGTLEKYTADIKAGKWNSVVEKGMKETDIEIVLMAAHALKRIDIDELTLALMFIDVAMELTDENKKYSIRKFPNTGEKYNKIDADLLKKIPGHLQYEMVFEDYRVRSLPLSYAFALGEYRNQSNGLDMKLCPTYKMSNVLKFAEHFLNRESLAAFKKPGSKTLIHGLLSTGFFYWHDLIHWHRRLENQNSFAHISRHVVVLKDYFQKMPPYSKEGRPQAVPGKSWRVLPEKANPEDRLRYVVEQSIMKLCDIELHVNKHIHKPASLYNHLLSVEDELKDVLSQEEKNKLLTDLRVFYKDEWEQLQ